MKNSGKIIHSGTHETSHKNKALLPYQFQFHRQLRLPLQHLRQLHTMYITTFNSISSKFILRMKFSTEMAVETAALQPM